MLHRLLAPAAVGLITAAALAGDPPAITLKKPGLLTWGDRVFVTAERPWIVAPQTAETLAFNLEPDTRLISAAVTGKILVTLTRNADAAALTWHAPNEAPRRMSMPAGLDAEAVVLAARGSRAVLTGTDTLATCTDGNWQVQSIPAPPRSVCRTPKPVLPRSVVLLEHRPLAGFDCGEWGGALLALGLNDLTWQEVATAGEPVRAPVQSLQEDSRGCIWVLAGLAHLQEAQFEVLSGCDVPLRRRASTEPLAVGCRLPAEPWDGLAIDTERRVWLLSRRSGLFRLDGERLQNVTPQWSPAQQPSGFCITPRCAAVLSKTGDVLLIDLRSGKTRQVPPPTQ